MAPVPADQFLRDYWEQKPLLIKRKSPDYYNHPRYLPGSFALDDVLRVASVPGALYEHDLDVTLYSNDRDKRDTLNDDGLVDTDRIKKLMDSKLCSVRLRCPQAKDGRVFRLLELLEHSFATYVGCNVYCTPANS